MSQCICVAKSVSIMRSDCCDYVMSHMLSLLSCCTHVQVRYTIVCLFVFVKQVLLLQSVRMIAIKGFFRLEISLARFSIYNFLMLSLFNTVYMIVKR